MAVDKLVDSTQLDSDLTSVANAIRAKSGGSSQLAFPAGFVSEIQAIPSGGGVTVASGTVSGNGSNVITIPLGVTRIPIRNFGVFLWLPGPDTIAYSTKNDIIHAFMGVCDPLCYLVSGTVESNSGYWPCRGGLPLTVVKSDSSTTEWSSDSITAYSSFDYYIAINKAASIRGGSSSSNAGRWGVKIANGAASLWKMFPGTSYELISGKTYSWKLVWFGTNQANDFITIQ